MLHRELGMHERHKWVGGIMHNERAEAQAIPSAVGGLGEKNMKHIVEFATPVGGILVKQPRHDDAKGRIALGLLKTAAGQRLELVVLVEEILAKLDEQREDDPPYAFPGPAKAPEGRQIAVAKERRHELRLVPRRHQAGLQQERPRL